MRSRPFWMIPVILLLATITLVAQTWTPVDPQTIPVSGKKDIKAPKCITYAMEYQTMKTILWSAPQEYATPATSSNTIITIGLADGTADMFRVVQIEMMEAPLAAQYPDIKVFRGISMSDPYRTMRADWTVNGFRAVISDLSGKTFIDYYQRNDLSHCIAYRADEYSRETDWSCDIDPEQFHPGNTTNRVVGDCEFRSYQLAVATTGEYSNYFGATSSSQSALVLSQVVTAINRVNDVYEVDFATRLILVADTDDVFYYDPGTDPYTNDNGNAMLNQNQTTLDNIIGNSNYDIGHVFSTGGGGVAVLPSVCSASNKAKGVTGSGNPVGDPFVIDYVAHEMGHQFGAHHTQNNDCNRTSATAMEPGSASTIMGYAGICNPNVQNNSDDYMHGISLQEINARISGTSCETVISTSNTAPNVSNFPNYTIPISTPFVLTASATDGDNNPLTYCWEQWDPEVGAVMPPVSTNVTGPMFRSLDPTSSPSRYFPNIASIIAGTNPTWEELPSVTRDMEFRVTVRDLYNGVWGCTDEDNCIISTTSTSGPFIVTSQGNPTTWTEASNQTITWNVANTTASPVSCANVNILLSYDGGYTYPVMLAQNTPNDGSHVISVPAGTTTTGRIMVRGANTIFFDINNANITINPGLPNFTITLNPSIITECNDGSVQTTVEVGQFMGFTDPVTLSALSLPPGAMVTFNPSVVVPGSTSQLTISNLNGLFGTFTPTVRGTSTTGVKDAILTLNLQAPPAAAPTLQSPANNETNVVITPTLDWQTQTGVTQYLYQLAYDAAFNNLVMSGATITDQFSVTSPLIVNQTYYWRVSAVNSCGAGVWSGAFSFTTGNCISLMSTDVPVTIPSSGTPTVISDFDCPVDMVITDVNVINLSGSHSWVHDLQFLLVAPDGTEQLIWDRPCDNHDDFSIQFGDEAASMNWPCPPTDGLNYKPSDTLSFFNNKNAENLWQLKIMDVADQDGGQLNTWGLKVCGNIGCQLTVNQATGTGTGSLPAAISCSSAGDTIRLASLLVGQTINIGSAPLLLDKNIVILGEAQGINVTGSGARVFTIPATRDVMMKEFTLTAGTSMDGGAVSNTGILRLNNMFINANASAPGASLVRNNLGGQVFVDGNTRLEQ